MSGPDDRTPDVADEDAPTSWWGYLGGAAIALAVAVACFTPLWDEVAHPSSGRRALFANVLMTLGPFGVAGIAVAVAVVLVVVAMGVRRRGDG